MSQGTLPKPAQGPPYPPRIASPGGLPTIIPDIPICAVFILFYLSFAVTNLTLFNLNRRKGHFFLPNALLGGFCMARVLTCCLRIGWATRHNNVSLGVAAQIFVNAGILIVYILNLIFAQRILRAKQPGLGWHRILKAAFITAYCLIGVALVLVIVMTVLSVYTLQISTLVDAKWIERGAVTYLLIFTTFPIILLAVAYGLPRSDQAQTFGTGSLNLKAAILTLASCICIFIAGFKAGVFWSPSHPVTDPAWYDSKAAFYCFEFMPEVFVLILYTSARFWRLFHVPDGSSKRFSYLPPREFEDLASVDEMSENKKSSMESSSV